MIFAKLDVCVPTHPKFIAAGPAAVGFWCAALAYVRGHELDGMLPDHAVGVLLGVGPLEGRKLAARLVSVGLFERIGDGYAIFNYASKNETKAQIEARRAATRERVADLRTKRRGSQATDMVYFARLPSNRVIKIGWSSNVGDRIAQLRSEFKEPVELLCTLAGGADLEASFHVRFSSSRIAGEWFEPSEELETLVETIRGNASISKSSNKPSSGVTRYSVTHRVPGSGSGSDSVISEGERERGTNATVDGAWGGTVDSWADGIRLATGSDYMSVPRGKNAVMVSAALKSAIKPGEEPCEAARKIGAEYAKANSGRTLSPLHFGDWMASGRPPASVRKAPERDREQEARVAKEERLRIEREVNERAARAAGKVG